MQLPGLSLEGLACQQASLSSTSARQLAGGTPHSAGIQLEHLAGCGAPGSNTHSNSSRWQWCGARATGWWVGACAATQHDLPGERGDGGGLWMSWQGFEGWLCWPRGGGGGRGGGRPGTAGWWAGAW
jgi:hypothetical protein